MYLGIYRKERSLSVIAGKPRTGPAGLSLAKHAISAIEGSKERQSISL